MTAGTLHLYQVTYLSYNVQDHLRGCVRVCVFQFPFISGFNMIMLMVIFLHKIDENDLFSSR